jgi:hypothetical protein
LKPLPNDDAQGKEFIVLNPKLVPAGSINTLPRLSGADFNFILLNCWFIYPAIKKIDVSTV